MVFFRMLRCRDIQNIALRYVDHLSVGVCTQTLLTLAVAQMDVAVQQVFGAVFFQQGKKRVETPVGGIFRIPHAGRRRMGDNDVHALAAPQAEAQLGDPPRHLPLCILVGAGVILPAAA